MGSFIALYGIDNSRRLIAEALAQLLPSVGFRPIADTRSISCEFAATPVGGASLGHFGPGTTQLKQESLSAWAARPSSAAPISHS